MYPLLMKVKTEFNSSLEWGRFFVVTTADKKILQFAWRDSSVVLFMSIIGAAAARVERDRKRPGGMVKSTKWVREQWGSEPVKKLLILELIDQYNHKMNGIDLADQMRSYYFFKRY